MSEHQERAGPEVRLDLGVVDGLLGRVGDEEHHHVGLADGRSDGRDAEPGVLGQLPALRALGEADHDIHARVAQVLRVGVAL